MNSNDSLLLDIECKRMLTRKSKQNIIFEVIQKLQINKNLYISKNISYNHSNSLNNFYEYILKFFGCLKK